jgi:hypothetical protein
MAGTGWHEGGQDWVEQFHCQILAVQPSLLGEPNLEAARTGDIIERGLTLVPEKSDFLIHLCHCESGQGI